MLDPTVLAFVGGALIGTAGAVVAYLTHRRKAPVELKVGKATAKLDEAKAADLLIRNLTEQYTLATDQMVEMREAMIAQGEEIGRLRAQVEQQSMEISALRARITAFEHTVQRLPAEVRDRFDEAMSQYPQPNTDELS